MKIRKMFLSVLSLRTTKSLGWSRTRRCVPKGGFWLFLSLIFRDNLDFLKNPSLQNKVNPKKAYLRNLSKAKKLNKKQTKKKTPVTNPVLTMATSPGFHTHHPFIPGLWYRLSLPHGGRALFWAVLPD